MSLEGSRRDFLPSLTPDQVSQINEQKAEGMVAFQQPSKQTHSEYGKPPSSGYGQNYAAFYGYAKQELDKDVVNYSRRRAEAMQYSQQNFNQQQ